MPKKTRDEYNAYMRAYMLQKYRDRRARVLVILGGVCATCGATEDLQVDHVDRRFKRYKLSKMLNALAWHKVTQELMACQALCPACHHEKSSREMSVGHGGGLTGKKNCHCELCGPLKNEYLRHLRVRQAIAEAIAEQRISTSTG